MNTPVRVSLFLAIWLAVSISASAAIPTSERNALIALYDSTGGNNWHVTTGWKGAAGTECDWFGIICDQSRSSVIGIYFDFNNITGTIPGAPLAALPNLEMLFLTRNQLTGPIPPEIGKLSKLRYFAAASNQLTGAIPSQLGTLTSLEKVELAVNQLSGPIPDLGGLIHLESLILGWNQLTGTIPPSLGNLSSLVTLDLQSNALTGGIPVELARLTKLENLLIDYNGLTGSIPREIGTMTSLRHLSVDLAGLNGAIPAEITRLTNLEKLHLSGNSLTGSLPPGISALRALQELDLGNNQLSGHIPSELGNLTALTSLDLSGNAFDGTLPSELGNLSALEYFSVYGDSLSGTIPPALGKLAKLQVLILGENDFTGGIPPELMQLTKLKGLELSGNRLEREIPATIVRLADLEYLGLSDNLLSGTIPSGVSVLTRLDELHLRGNQLTGPIPSLGFLVFLQTLDLGSNMLTGSIPSDIGSLRELEFLNLSSNQLSGALPSSLWTLGKLTHLDLGFNRFSGPIPPEIGNLTLLEDLDLGSNDLSGNVPEQLLNLRALRFLRLGYNSLSGSIPSGLGSLSALETLQLDGNQFTGTIPASLGNLTKLHSLGLGSNQLGGEVPAQLANLQGLDDRDGLDLTFNALYTSSDSLRQFLNKKDLNNDFELTQTVTPAHFTVSTVAGTSVVLAWDRTKYWWHVGGFEIEVSRTPGGTPEKIVTTPDKEVTSQIIQSLAPNTAYSFRVRTATYPHDVQQNVLRSPFSSPLSATTGAAVTQPPNIVVTMLPFGIVQEVNQAGGDDFFAVTNVGDVQTTVSLTPNGSFFTLPESSASIGPHESVNMHVVGLAKPAGAYTGSVALSGTGVKAGLSVPVKLLSIVPPAGSVIAEASVTRLDLIAPEGESPHGAVSFRNNGTATLNGIVLSDVAWIVPPTGLVTIAAGQTASVEFSIDRSKRPDAGELEGTVSGNLMLLYADGGTGFKGDWIDADPPGGTSVSTVTVVDTVQSAAVAATLPPLAGGEIALVIPGVTQLAQSGGAYVTDVSITNVFGTADVTDLKLYYSQSGTAQSYVSTVGAVGINQTMKLGNVVRSRFGREGQTGSLQLRSRDANRLAVSALLASSTTSAGTFGTGIPVFRSDRAAADTQKIVLTGIRADAPYRTDINLQEMSGYAATARIEFLNASGSAVGAARAPDSVSAFALTQLKNVAPAGAVTAVITVGGTGRLCAYAMVNDTASGDMWTVVDWARMHDFSQREPQLVPLAGSLQSTGATPERRRAIKRPSGGSAAVATTYRSDVSIFNSGTTVANATLRYYDAGGAATKLVSLPARNTLSIVNASSYFGRAAASTGYLVVDVQSGSVAVTSRIYFSATAGTFSTGVPVVAATAGARIGQVKVMSGLDDSRKASARDSIAGTSTTNLVLAETAGKQVKVRASLSYADGRSLVVAIGGGSREFTLQPHQFLLLPNLAAAILGESRETSLGDLSNVSVRFQVTAGDGAAAVLTNSIDNRSGDPTVRYE